LAYFTTSIFHSQLTAAHCAGAFALGARLFISALSSTDYAEISFVDAFIQNEGYILVSNEDGFIADIANDIAVVRLNATSAEPLTVWSNNTNEPNAGDLVRVVGFGRTVRDDSNSSSPVLLETTLTVLGNDVCQQNLLFEPDQMACSSSETSTPCRGDSGSPYFDTTTNAIVGVHSFGTCIVGGRPTRRVSRIMTRGFKTKSAASRVYHQLTARARPLVATVSVHQILKMRIHALKIVLFLNLQFHLNLTVGAKS